MVMCSGYMKLFTRAPLTKGVAQEVLYPGLTSENSLDSCKGYGKLKM